MKQKEDNPIKTLFEFSGDAKGKMSLSVILTVLSELFGMLPYLTAAMLANEVFAGTATNCRSRYHPQNSARYCCIQPQP